MKGEFVLATLATAALALSRFGTSPPPPPAIEAPATPEPAGIDCSRVERISYKHHEVPFQAWFVDGRDGYVEVTRAYEQCLRDRGADLMERMLALYKSASTPAELESIRPQVLSLRAELDALESPYEVNFD